MKKLLILLFLPLQLFAQQGVYNQNAGVSKVNAPAPRDQYNNVKGDNYDLVPDKAFEKVEVQGVQKLKKDEKITVSEYNYAPVTSKSGAPAPVVKAKPRTVGTYGDVTVLVLFLCQDSGADFEKPRKALESKGFSVYLYYDFPPAPTEFKRALELSTQLWVISDRTQKLSSEHQTLIKKYFDEGHGVYIFGDNDPYNADADPLANLLVGSGLAGDDMGNEVVGLKKNSDKSGLVPDHLITTGLENVFEGITISTVKETKDLKPIMYSSVGKLVTAAYENNGKRLIIDGGFTRLYAKWETAGTDRYIKNAAAWLVNMEKFGIKKK